MVEKTKTSQVVDSGVKVAKDPVTLITKAQFVNLLFCVKGVTFIGANTTTVPKMNKGGKACLNTMYGNVVKDSTINCMLGFDYETRRDKKSAQKWVEETIQAAREAGVPDDVISKSIDTLREYSTESIEKFEAKPRKWGKHMKNPNTGKLSRIMVNHTKIDKKSGKLLPETYAEYMQVEILSSHSPVYHYKDSGEILSAEDLEMVKKYLAPSRPDDLIIRGYSIGNVRKVRINGEHYQIKD